MGTFNVVQPFADPQAKGDADGHDVWLLTSNAYKFYELLGFSVAGETTVGAEDPTWDQEPVALRLVGGTILRRRRKLNCRIRCVDMHNPP